MSKAPLRLSRDRGVATVTLAAGASLDDALAQELCSVAETVAADREVAVVLIRGSGRDFAAGGQSSVDWSGAIAAVPQPLIAAVQGDAVDEGAELAMIADLRLCGRTARLRFGHLADERMPRHGATQRLPRVVGRTRALDLLLSGRWVRAAEAARIGLATEVVAPDRLARRSRELARELAAKGPTALRFAKEAVSAGLDMTLAQGIRLEQDLYVLLQTTEDRAEGVRSFLDNRRPHYRGR